ncbi:MAG TPA: SPOR domain-containing protein, partial [Acetobacteraceae bacterium]|nr:SPOR domain-containing protein [Acetobacteraceae bacterium]
SPVPSFGPPAPPLRLPDTVTRTTPAPGRLFVRLSSFHGYRYAAMQRDRLAALRPEIVAVQPGGVQEFRVRLGPFATISEADAMLDRALAAGVTEARIVVDE